MSTHVTEQGSTPIVTGSDYTVKVSRAAAKVVKQMIADAASDGDIKTYVSGLTEGGGWDGTFMTDGLAGWVAEIEANPSDYENKAAQTAARAAVQTSELRIPWDGEILS